MSKFVFVLAFCFLAFARIHSLNLTEYQPFIEALSKDVDYAKAFDENIKFLLDLEPNYYDYMPKDAFPCRIAVDNRTARNVHELRPQDVKIVAALGDSLTASLGSNAKTVLGLLLEYRGRSWSTGGDKQYEKLVTLPNILKNYNPNLYGYTNGIDFALLTKTGVGFNAAVSGQEANHVHDQAKVLLDRMRNDKNVDFQNDWKIVTLFIGGNDLCDFCNDRVLHSPRNFITDIQTALDLLYKELPKAFVNLVTVLNVDDVKLLNRGFICSTLHKFVCKCAAFPENAEQEEELKLYIKEYQEFTEELVASGRYEGRDDFTVVVQPFFKNFRLPRLADGKIDFSFFAPDCFHFSTKGQAAAATSLWNNMLQPIGEKHTSWDPDHEFLCPDETRPYFFTSKNSKSIPAK